MTLGLSLHEFGEMTLGQYWRYKNSYFQRLRLTNAPMIQVCNMIASYFQCDGFDSKNIYPVHEEEIEIEEEENL